MVRDRAAHAAPFKTKARGSYLRWLTANRLSGHGCRILTGDQKRPEDTWQEFDPAPCEAVLLRSLPHGTQPHPLEAGHNHVEGPEAGWHSVVPQPQVADAAEMPPAHRDRHRAQFAVRDPFRPAVLHAVPRPGGRPRGVDGQAQRAAPDPDAPVLRTPARAGQDDRNIRAGSHAMISDVPPRPLSAEREPDLRCRATIGAARKVESALRPPARQDAMPCAGRYRACLRSAGTLHSGRECHIKREDHVQFCLSRNWFLKFLRPIIVSVSAISA